MGACASRMGMSKREGLTPIDEPSTPKEDIVKTPPAVVTDTEKVLSGGVVVVEKEADVNKSGNGGEKESGNGEVEGRENGGVEEKYESKQTPETEKQDCYRDEGKRRSLGILFKENDASENPRLDDNSTKEEEVTTGFRQVKVSEAEQVVVKPLLEDAGDKVEEKQSICGKVSEAEQVVVKPLEDAEDNIEEKQSICDKVSEEVQIKVVEIENLMISTQDEQSVEGKEPEEVENKEVEVVSIEEEQLTVIESKVVELMPVLEPIADKPFVGGETAEVEVEIPESNQSIFYDKVCAQEPLPIPETDNKVIDTETPDEVIKEQQVAEEPSAHAGSTNEPIKELQFSEKPTEVAELKVLEVEIAKESTHEEKPTEVKLTTEVDIKTENSADNSGNSAELDEPKNLSVEEIKEEIFTPKEEGKSTIVGSEAADVPEQEANTVPASEVISETVVINEKEVVKDVKIYETSTVVVETPKPDETPAKDNC